MWLLDEYQIITSTNYALPRQVNSARDKIKKMEADLVKKVFEEAQVICATCVGSGHEVLAGMTFSIVLVDEATQATEPSVLVPLVHKAKQVRFIHSIIHIREEKADLSLTYQVFLLGDHFQLPPTVISDRAREAGLNVSLFSRLANEGLFFDNGLLCLLLTSSLQDSSPSC